MGLGLGAPHYSSRTQSQVPRVGLDYFFITSGGIKKDSELELSDMEVEECISNGTIIKCIIVCDWDGKALWAHVVPRKGVHDDDYVPQLVVDDLKWMGYSRVILKYDWHTG